MYIVKFAVNLQCHLLDLNEVPNNIIALVATDTEVEDLGDLSFLNHKEEDHDNNAQDSIATEVETVGVSHITNVVA